MLTRSDFANAIRALSMDAVQNANSGHPGAPMGMADIAEVLWRGFLKHNPNNPKWVNRDRFILSNGHGSMLLYSLLHLTGYDLSINDIKNFRQLHSKTAGHPEYKVTPGVETTTGPLGQGLANAVGMAIAEKTLAAQFNRPNYNLIDHYTYVFTGDGCLMEGISHEVCSLAGTLKLGKLIVIYDDNGISIDGNLKGWFTDNTAHRFESYGWEVIAGVDGHDSSAIEIAIKQARSQKEKPTLICCKTIIGFGSPNKMGKESCHGAPLGEAEVSLVRENLNWNYEPFFIPDSIYGGWNAKEKGAVVEAEWNERFASYEAHHPKLATDFKRRVSGQLPEDFTEKAIKLIQQCQKRGQSVASRRASQSALECFGALLPELLGGSADLTNSNLTLWDGAKGIKPNDADGNYIFYGVREFGMSAIMNGIALHGGFIPYGGTFLVFMEYARNAIRMAALMKQRVIFVYTHDSIGLGEDGPTHQPIEQLANLRMTPNITTWRPCDATESMVAWKEAIEDVEQPSALVFSRQTLEAQDRTEAQTLLIMKGGYVLVDCDGTPDLILIATGSEVSLATKAKIVLCEAQKNLNVRVVSMPSTERFDAQDETYRHSVLPPNVTRRIAIEAAMADFWYKYVGLDGLVVGMRSFGESAPASDLFEHFGFTVDNIVRTAQGLLS